MNSIFIIAIILIAFGLLSLGISIVLFVNIGQTHEYNKEIDKQNKELKQENKLLSSQQEEIKDSITLKEKERKDIITLIDIQKQSLKDIQNAVDVASEQQKALSQKAYENYCQILNKSYEDTEEEYQLQIKNLQDAYENSQSLILLQLNEAQADLDKVKATRTAAIEALLKEKEIKEQSSFYCLSVDQNELDDIQVLERIKPKLHNPRILSMLIWSTYFQKPMNNLCNNILGTTVVTGIYKITNQLTDMCYIGQAVDVARRWKEHAKCGLGIDTPASNKLYQSMIKDGLWNFSFELLEECPRTELNEKEKYYIQLYQSYEYGFNSNSGIK